MNKVSGPWESIQVVKRLEKCLSSQCLANAKFGQRISCIGKRMINFNKNYLRSLFRHHILPKQPHQTPCLSWAIYLVAYIISEPNNQTLWPGHDLFDLCKAFLEVILQSQLTWKRIRATCQIFFSQWYCRRWMSSRRMGICSQRHCSPCSSPCQQRQGR